MFADLVDLRVQNKPKAPCTAELLQLLPLDPPVLARLAGTAETTGDLALHCLHPTHPKALVSPSGRSRRDSDRAPNAIASSASCNGFAGLFLGRFLPCSKGGPLVLRRRPEWD